MLAKDVNDNACLLDNRGALKFFASKLAPTFGFVCGSGLQGDFDQLMQLFNLHRLGSK